MPRNLTFEVATSDDLGVPLYQALQTQIALSKDGPASLEVVLAPGVYDTIAISIKDGSPSSKLDITLRGDPEDPPTIKVPVELAGANLQLKNVVISDARVSHPVTTLRVGKTLAVDGVSWVDNAREEDQLTNPLVKIQASYKTGPQQIAFSNSWFVGNKVSGTANLISLETVRPDIVSELSFTNTAFVGNHASVVVAPEFSELVTFKDCFVNEADNDAFLWIRNTVSQVAFSDSGFGYGGREAPVRYKGTSPIPAADYRQATFANTLRWGMGFKGEEALQAYANEQARAGTSPDQVALLPLVTDK